MRYLFISFSLEGVTLERISNIANSLERKGLVIVIDGDKKELEIKKEDNERRVNNAF